MMKRTLFVLIIIIFLINCENTVNKNDFEIILSFKDYKNLHKPPINTNTTGYTIYYFENGRVSDEGTLLNGKKIGTWTSYYQNGGVKSTISYLNDIPEGKTVLYYENQKIKEIGYQFANKYPEIKSYMVFDSTLKDSILIEEIKDSVILKHGNWLEYDINGNLVSTIHYEKGIVSPPASPSISQP